MSDTKNIGYDDILAGMNLFVENGQLRIIRGKQQDNTEPPRKIEIGNKEGTQNTPESKLSEEEKREAQRIHLIKVREERMRKLRYLQGIREAKSKGMKYINNYPAQLTDHSPRRVETVFPLKL